MATMMPLATVEVANYKDSQQERLQVFLPRAFGELVVE